jgi:hypothetical protein
MLVEAPCFSRGKLDFSPAEKEFTLEMGFSRGISPRTALKRMIKLESFSER